MQLSFNPLDPDECGAIQMVIAVLVNAKRPENQSAHGMTPLTPDAVAILNAQHGKPGAPVIAILADNGQDQRDPAAAFGVSAAPLAPPALFTAGATPSPNALAGAPAGLPVSLPGTLGAAQLPAATVNAVPGNATPAANPAGTVELDTQGLPWDSRIHASTKSKTKAGEWTKLRGFNDEAKYKAIVAELKAAVALPPAGAVAGTYTPPAAAAPVQAMPMPLPTPAAVMPPAPPGASPAVLGVPQNFDELMPRITAAQTAQQIPAGALEAALGAFQLPGVIALVSRPDYVPHVWDYLKKQYPTLV